MPTKRTTKTVRKMTPKARAALHKAAKDTGIIDEMQIKNTDALLTEAAGTLRSLRANRGAIDLDTAEKMGSKAHQVIGKLHEMLAVLETIKSVRRRQSTALVGGKRRKA
jgi:capsule polysaccharide export protein KpsE/RkpR